MKWLWNQTKTVGCTIILARRIHVKQMNSKYAWNCFENDLRIENQDSGNTINTPGCSCVRYWSQIKSF